jgi:hypothetical protein
VSTEFAGVVRFLAEHRDMVLFCRDRDGCPVGYPMRSTSVTDSAIYFTTYRKSAKVQHLERDPVVRLLCFVTGDGDRVEWVDAGGTAVLWSPTADELDRLLSGPRDPRVPAGMLDHVRTRILEGKRIMIKVELDHAAQYAGTTATG